MKETIKVLDQLEATHIKKPQFNGFLTGHGKHKKIVEQLLKEEQ